MKKIILILSLLLIPSLVWAAGSVTQSWTSVNEDVSVLTFSWTGDASGGAVTATASESNIDGFVFLVVTNPGSTAPTPSYDITLTDADGVDIMGGKLADRSATASEQEIPKVGSGLGSRFVSGTLTLNITNQSVNSATGTVLVFIYNER